MSVLFSIALLKIVNLFLFVCFIAPRSGLAAKHFIDVGGNIFTFLFCKYLQVFTLFLQ